MGCFQEKIDVQLAALDNDKQKLGSAIGVDPGGKIAFLK